MSELEFKNIENKEEITELMSGLDETLFHKVTNKQAAFIKAYLQSFNSRKAAIAVGYAPKSAALTGSRLLKDPDVIEALEKIKHQVLQKSAYTLEKAIAETDTILTESRNKNQYSAASKILELKLRLTDHIKDRMVVEHDIRPNFIIQIPCFKAPAYSKDEKDVTPRRKKIKDDGTS